MFSFSIVAAPIYNPVTIPPAVHEGSLFFHMLATLVWFTDANLTADHRKICFYTIFKKYLKHIQCWKHHKM